MHARTCTVLTPDHDAAVMGVHEQFCVIIISASHFPFWRHQHCQTSFGGGIFVKVTHVHVSASQRVIIAHLSRTLEHNNSDVDFSLLSRAPRFEHERRN